MEAYFRPEAKEKEEVHKVDKIRRILDAPQKSFEELAPVLEEEWPEEAFTANRWPTLRRNSEN